MPIDSRRRDLLLGAAATGALLTLTSLTGLAQARQGKPARRMPVIFAGHGTPMNALRDNAFTSHLKAWGAALPKPDAILSVSAHWLTPGYTVAGIQERPRTIHDFGGFPAALHAMQYPAPGAPEFAREAAALVKQQPGRTTPEWGLDHGTWTVLHHMFPNADIPVFQLSIDYDRDGRFHYAVGRELAALRERGVLIMGSGNVVHNLRATERMAPDGAATQAWASAYDKVFKQALGARDDKRLAQYESLDGSAAMAVPTPDHYYPFLYALGAAGAGEKAQNVFEGFQAGTISMRCIQFG